MQDINTFKAIRIVWNLTNNCPFNCQMCVASANTRKEKGINKDKILESILSIPNNMLSIDFSGGDPLFKNDDIAIIKKAALIIGKDNVSISTTGLSLAKLSDFEILSLAHSYDITYDFPKKHYEEDLRDKKYNSLNYEQAQRLLDLGLEVDIYLPIRRMPLSYLDELAKDLAILNPSSIHLLKCMPLNNHFDTGEIDAILYADFLIQKIRQYGYTKEITPNCALKEDYKCPNNCNMLTERKIGLDQFGDLYTCIWAADLLIDKSLNPFYLGNAYETSLREILSSQRITELQSSLSSNRNTCHVLKYYQDCFTKKEKTALTKVKTN